MTVKRFGSGVPYTAGMWPQMFGVANFSPANAGALLILANEINEDLAKRLKVLFSWWTDQSNVNNPDTPARALIFVSPNVYGDISTVKYLRARLVLTASRYDAASKPAPQVGVKLRSFTGAGDLAAFSGTYVDNTHRDANIGPLNYWSVDLEIPMGTVTPRGQTYELAVETNDLCQVISMSVHEVSRLALSDERPDVFVDAQGFHVGGRVYDDDLADLWDKLQACYDRQGSVYFAWAPMDSSKAASLGGTLTNLFDANTAWDLAAYGFWCWPQHAGTLDSDDVGVIVWAIVEIDPTDVGAGQFLGAVAFVSEFGTIGQIDVQNYQLVIPDTLVIAIALQTSWVGASAQADGKVDVLGSYAGGNSLKVLACGMYAKGVLDPRSIPDLALWLAADQLALADGDPVTTWADRSGNANDATGAGGTRPTYHTGVIAGRPVVRFDGVDDVLAIADADSYKAAELTVFVVASVTGGGADMIALCYPHAGTHTSPYFRWALDFRTASNLHLVVAADVESATADFATSTLFRTWMYMTHERRLHRDGAEMHQNSGAGPSATYPTAVGLRIGADVAGGECFGGDIAEILIFARSLTYAEYTAVDQYLSEKYGLQRSPT